MEVSLTESILLKPTIGYVLYFYDPGIASRTRLDSSAWLCYGEFQTREEAVYEMYLYQKENPEERYKINKESIFL